MEQILLIFHVLAAVALVGLVLLQQGKGAEMGASFGSGASQTLFGSTGSVGFLARATGFLAFFFFATSVGLAIVASDKAKQTGEFRIEVPAAVEVPANLQDILNDTGDSEVPVAPDALDVPAAPEGDTPAAEETPAILQEALDAEAQAAGEAAGADGATATPERVPGAMPPQ